MVLSEDDQVYRTSLCIFHSIYRFFVFLSLYLFFVFGGSSSLHVRIVELVQDVVSVLLLPLYFAVSGLKTDLTLLDNATSWGICVLTIAAACLGECSSSSSSSSVYTRVEFFLLRCVGLCWVDGLSLRLTSGHRRGC